MDSFVEFLISIGPAGMLFSAFLAGSIFPFNSEIVMAGLFAAGVPVASLLIWGTIGNVAGGLLNYGIGRLCSLEWIGEHMRIRRDRIEKAQTWVASYGAWVALLAWVPILGSAITYALGLMRANLWLSTLAMTIGKFARYAILIWLVGLI